MAIRTSANTNPGWLIAIAVLIVGCAAGWLMNIVKLAASFGDNAITTEFLFRAAGIPVVPLGVVLGWL